MPLSCDGLAVLTPGSGAHSFREKGACAGRFVALRENLEDGVSVARNSQ